MVLFKNLLRAVRADKLNSSKKVNRKVCLCMAALIAVAGFSVTVASQQTSTTVHAESLVLGENIPEVTPTSAIYETTTNVDTLYNVNSYCNISISKYGKSNKYLVAKTSVKDALSTAKVSVGKKDVMNCKYSDSVKDGMDIRIDKVVYKTKNVTQTVSYKKFVKSYPGYSTKGLDKTEKVKVSKKLSVKYVNGKKKSSTIKSISYKSLDSSVKYSSLKTISELIPKSNFKLNKKGIPVSYSKKITGTASAYSCGTHTATGKRVKPGYIAVNPRQIPYGTKMFIRSSDGNYIYGYASAEDTGGFVAWGNTLCDLFFWSESACEQFGRRTVEIYILK